MQKTILQSWGDNFPIIRATTPLETDAGVIDAAAFKTIEVDELFDKLNYAHTTVGQAVLYRSLTQPLDNLAAINAKQDALKELEKNPSLKQDLDRMIKNAAFSEQAFYILLFTDFLGSLGIVKEQHQIEGYGYRQYKRGVRFLLELVDEVKAIDMPSSAYLADLLKKITAFSETRSYALMVGPVYISEQGIQSKREREGNFYPAIIFKPTIFKPLFIASCFAFVWLMLHFFPSEMFNFSAEAIPVASIFFIPLLLVYFPIVGGYDRDNCIIPLRNEFKQSQAVGEVLDALGQLDELLSFINYAEQFANPTVLPTMVEAEHHQIQLTAAKNPVLAKANPDYVGNDFSLQNQKLAFITGPNSGGKTAFCKTVTQIQLLAQMGCYVPASSATLTVADKIFYQAPEISHLDDGEGRFGTELKRTRDIFLATSSKSLVVLDELSEGTTFEEKLESSTNVLDGFYRKGNNTLLITHNHQLVDSFAKKRKGLALQTEFAEDAPTYRLVSGISRVSHADRVAKKIGFSKQDIDNYLADSK
jgi:DNA mismatch repair protein MutS